MHLFYLVFHAVHQRCAVDYIQCIVAHIFDDFNGLTAKINLQFCGICNDISSGSAMEGSNIHAGKTKAVSGDRVEVHNRGCRCQKGVLSLLRIAAGVGR